MPAKSKAQQKFMGMVHAAQAGEKPASKEVAKVAKGMPKKAAKDFASTKHKGLPAHVGEAKKTTSKAEKDMAESFEKAMEGSIRGGVWTSQPPDKGQKDVPPPQEVDGGILNKKQPKPVNAPRTAPVKKAEVTPTADTEEPVTAGMKRTGKKVSEGSKPDFLDMDKDGDKKEPMKKAVADKKKNPFGNKKVDEAKDKEPEGTYSKKRFETDGQRVARLAKEKRQAEKKKAEEKVDEAVAEKCWPGHRKVGTQPGTGKNKGKRVNDCEKIKEETKPLKGGQRKLDVAEPKGKLTGADFKALKGKKKVKESQEDRLMAIARNALQAVQMLRESKKAAARIKNLPISESDEYFAGLNAQLKKQIKG